MVAAKPRSLTQTLDKPTTLFSLTPFNFMAQNFFHNNYLFGRGNQPVSNPTSIAFRPHSSNPRRPMNTGQELHNQNFASASSLPNISQNPPLPNISTISSLPNIINTSSLPNPPSMVYSQQQSLTNTMFHHENLDEFQNYFLAANLTFVNPHGDPITTQQPSEDMSSPMSLSSQSFSPQQYSSDDSAIFSSPENEHISLPENIHNYPFYNSEGMSSFHTFENPPDSPTTSHGPLGTVIEEVTESSFSQPYHRDTFGSSQMEPPSPIVVEHSHNHRRISFPPMVERGFEKIKVLAARKRNVSQTSLDKSNRSSIGSTKQGPSLPLESSYISQAGPSRQQAVENFPGEKSRPKKRRIIMGRSNEDEEKKREKDRAKSKKSAGKMHTELDRTGEFIIEHRDVLQHEGYLDKDELLDEEKKLGRPRAAMISGSIIRKLFAKRTWTKGDNNPSREVSIKEESPIATTTPNPPNFAALERKKTELLEQLAQIEELLKSKDSTT